MKKTRITALFLLTIFIFSPFNNYAYESGVDESVEQLKLYLGEVDILQVSNPTKVIIGNPDIVDITGATTTELTLSPKAVGVTNLIVRDNLGEQSFKVIVVPENMDEVKVRIDDILDKLDADTVYTRTADSEGKVLLLGYVKSPEERERINTALGSLKGKIVDLLLVKEEESLVEIDVQVLELDKDATKTLGFTWPTTSTITITEAAGPIAAASAVPISRLFTVDSLFRTQFTWKLDALVKEGKARILSRPRLACQSGKEAVLLVGGEKPILTTEVAATTGAQGTNVEYKEFGIKLKIKPTVSDEDRIKVALDVEISEVGTVETLGTSSATSTTTTAKAFPLTKRNASTELFLNDGQTLAIGGLIKQKTEEDYEKVAFLGDLPIIGALFRKKTLRYGGGTGERGNTELFITLTPTIIESKAKAKKIKEEELAPKDSLLAEEVSAVVATPGMEMEIPDYTAIIQKRILKSLVYPRAAKDAGYQGTVNLRLHLLHSGKLLGVEVKSSSGHKILDDSALSVTKEIDYYPPFPPTVDKKELWVEVPIVYRLN